MRRLAVIICSLLLTLAAHAQDAAPLFTVLAGAVPDFTPLLISNCVFWLDASNVASIYKSGNSITNITTRPNGFSFVQATTDYSPRLTNSAISFDGANDFMRLDLTTYYASHTVVIVVKRTGTGTAASGYFPPLSYNNTPAVDSGAPFYFKTDTQFASYPYFYDFGQSGSLDNQAYDDDPRRRHIIIVPVNTVSLSWPLYVDGESFGPASATSWTPALNADIILGKQYKPSRICACDIYEVVFYARALSTQEIGLLNNYLARKWNVTLTP